MVKTDADGNEYWLTQSKGMVPVSRLLLKTMVSTVSEGEFLGRPHRSGGRAPVSEFLPKSIFIDFVVELGVRLRSSSGMLPERLFPFAMKEKVDWAGKEANKEGGMVPSKLLFVIVHEKSGEVIVEET